MLKQVGALPLRKTKDGGIEVLLVSSRQSGRWVIPKGWPSKRLSDHDAAAREAKQEAGVTGKISATSFGRYAYRKATPAGSRLIEVSVFILRVRKAKKSWREQAERRRVWFDARTASRRVREPRLRALIAGLANGTKPA